jgi:dTDP-4-dehydrorhamnose reductase
MRIVVTGRDGKVTLRENPGSLHLAAHDQASRADFAKHVFASVMKLARPKARNIRIHSEYFSSRTRRPLNSRVSCCLLADRNDVYLPSWRGFAAQTVPELLSLSLEWNARP